MSDFKEGDEVFALDYHCSFGYLLDDRGLTVGAYKVIDTKNSFLGYVKAKSNFSDFEVTGNIPVKSLFKTKNEAIDGMIKRLESMRDE